MREDEFKNKAFTLNQAIIARKKGQILFQGKIKVEKGKK